MDIEQIDPSTTLNARQLAMAWQLCTATIRRYSKLDHNPLPSRRLPAGYRFRAGDVVEWLRHRAKAPQNLGTRLPASQSKGV
jgi:hypothetical protein